MSASRKGFVTGSTVSVAVGVIVSPRRSRAAVKWGNVRGTGERGRGVLDCDFESTTAVEPAESLSLPSLAVRMISCTMP